MSPENANLRQMKGVSLRWKKDFSKFFKTNSAKPKRECANLDARMKKKGKKRSLPGPTLIGRRVWKPMQAFLVFRFRTRQLFFNYY